jgi:hypothetical protein
MKSIFLFALTLSTLISNAQNLLTPSKKSFEKKWVKNDSYFMTAYVIKDTSKFEIGKVNTDVVINKNKLTIINRINMKAMKSTWVDTTIADIKTLKPIHHSSYNLQRDMSLDFGKIVKGFYNDKIKKKNIVINDTTNIDYFDSNLYSFLIGWLPLREGFKKDISIYDYNPNIKIGTLTVSITDVKSGIYESSKFGIRNVWLVTVLLQNGQNSVTTYYFDKSNRKLWKQEINSGGRKMVTQVDE